MNNLPVILFDVNETLMDMSPLKEKVNEILGKRGFRIWFNTLLHYSLVDNCTNQYHDFSALADAAFNLAATSLNILVNEKEKKAALSVIKQLKAHDDVPKGLQLLKDSGYRLATLTNSPPATLNGQLQSAGLQSFFEKALSVDEIKKYKPAAETYTWAAEQLSVHPSNMILVAAHSWDIAGALNAGLRAAFIQRKGQALNPLYTKPDFSGKDLMQVAKAIIASQTA